MLQKVRDTGEWEEWLLFILEGVTQTSGETVVLITEMKKLMQQFKHDIRSKYPKMYSQDLLNNLFKYPYTKIEFIQHDLNVSRNTAIRYLDTLLAGGFLVKHKIGRDNFYLNQRLFALLIGE